MTTTSFFASFHILILCVAMISAAYENEIVSCNVMSEHNTPLEFDSSARFTMSLSADSQRELEKALYNTTTIAAVNFFGFVNSHTSFGTGNKLIFCSVCFVFAVQSTRNCS